MVEKNYGLLFIKAIHAQAEREKVLQKAKTRLEAVVNLLSGPGKPEYSGWFVLLKKNSEARSGYEFVGFFNPSKDEPESEPEWDAAFPLSTLDSLPEFEGW